MYRNNTHGPGRLGPVVAAELQEEEISCWVLRFGEYETQLAWVGLFLSSKGVQ